MLIENIYLTNAVIYFYMFSIFYFLQTSLFTLPMKSKCLSTYSWVVSFGYFKSRVSFRAIRLCLTVSFKWAGEENHRLITCRHNIGKRLHMWPSSCPKWWVGYTHKNFHLNLNFRIWLWLFFFFFLFLCLLQQSLKVFLEPQQKNAHHITMRQIVGSWGHS